MSVPGIGLQTTTQFAPRPNNSRALNKGATNIQPASENTKADANSNALAASNQTNTGQAALLIPVTQPPNTNKSTTNQRQNLVEVETARKRFQLQGEKGQDLGGSGKAVQSFLDVADYERKDDLATLVGIDIYI
ncbi:MAG: hypothetical protein GY829_15760 [Gammaproteobacteria bacterium]|nr:hypothetical protein [Gammaproteobacteria bacterium]